MSNTIIITWVRNGMALGTKWYGTRTHGYEMTRNHFTSRPMCINKEKLCHGILSHVEKHNKLHNLSDMSDSNRHFQKILVMTLMSISFNSHLKRHQICSI